MKSRFSVLATLLLAALALAGCTTTSEPEVPVDASAFTLTVADMPSEVYMGETFSFAVKATGGAKATSTHIGAHYWADDVADPTASLATALACDHADAATKVPGSYTVTCSISEMGLWSVYGHVRVVDQGTTYDFWAPPQHVRVHGFVLTTNEVPESMNVGDSFPFEMMADGTPSQMTSHVGAHYWDELVLDPTARLADARACDHMEGEHPVPGMYLAHCNMDTAGTWYVYGHLRVTRDGQNFDFWAEPHEVTVRAI